jgi:hypothetical protein
MTKYRKHWHLINCIINTIKLSKGASTEVYPDCRKRIHTTSARQQQIWPRPSPKFQTAKEHNYSATAKYSALITLDWQHKSKQRIEWIHHHLYMQNP